jgi:hypothetical protein
MAEILSHVKAGEVIDGREYADGETVIALTYKEARWLWEICNVVNSISWDKTVPDYQIYKALTRAAPEFADPARERMGWTHCPHDFAACATFGIKEKT